MASCGTYGPVAEANANSVADKDLALIVNDDDAVLSSWIQNQPSNCFAAVLSLKCGAHMLIEVEYAGEQGPDLIQMIAKRDETGLCFAECLILQEIWKGQLIRAGSFETQIGPLKNPYWPVEIQVD